VRNLERAIGGVVRYKAVEWAEHLDAGTAREGSSTGSSDAIQRKEYDRVVEEYQLEKILGVARWDGEEREREARRVLFMVLWLWVKVRVGFCRSRRSRFLVRTSEVDGKFGEVCTSFWLLPFVYYANVICLY